MSTRPINRENDPRWKILGDYIRDVMEVLGLNRYHFDLSHNAPTEPGQSAVRSNGESVTAAHVFYSYGALKCIFHFGDIFFEDFCPEEQRHAVVHEIMHVLQVASSAHLDQLRQDEGLSNAVWDIWWKTYVFIHEREVDHLASVIAPRFSFIDWQSFDAVNNILGEST